MKTIAALLTVFMAIGIAAAQADETPDQKELHLPKPLNAIACDLGELEKHFEVAECKLFAADEFSVGNRVVAEETIVWTLAAKEKLNAKEVYGLLRPNPAPSPFAKVRFWKTIDGQEVAADAREQGYSLIGDLRWLGPKTGPDLAKGDKIQVWVHLGKAGSMGLLQQAATRLVVVAK